MIMLLRPETVSNFLLLVTSLFISTHAWTLSEEFDTTAVPAGPLTTQFPVPSSCFEIRTTAAYGIPGLGYACGEGKLSKECCPSSWASGVYYSPGMCPSSYLAHPLPTSRQREETTNICCPVGYKVIDMDFCYSPLSHPATMTYSDETFSTRRTQDYVKVTPIQIRFKASESDIVPVPTSSLSLPHEGLLVREKVGIGIGVVAGVVLITLGAYFCGARRWRWKKVIAAEQAAASQYPLMNTDSAPPPYSRSVEEESRPLRNK